MNLITLFYILFISLLPSLVWMSFVLKQDIHPEKIKDILKIFLVGMIGAVPVLGLSLLGKVLLQGTGIEISPILDTFVFGALNEEVVKAVLFYLFVVNSKFCDEPIDIFIYAGSIALGFAGIENIFVSIKNIGDLGGSLESILFLRTITAVVIHLVSTFLFAYFIYIFQKKKVYTSLLWGFLASIGFHGIYNMILQILKMEIYEKSMLFEIFYIVIFIPMFVYMINLVKKLQEDSK